MKIDVAFDNNLERVAAVFISLIVLGAVFFAGMALAPASARAEWDSDGSFGDGYYLRSISESLDHTSDIFYDMSSTLDDIERKLPF